MSTHNVVSLMSTHNVVWRPELSFTYQMNEHFLISVMIVCLLSINAIVDIIVMFVPLSTADGYGTIVHVVRLVLYSMVLYSNCKNNINHDDCKHDGKVLNEIA